MKPFTVQKSCVASYASTAVKTHSAYQKEREKNGRKREKNFLLSLLLVFFRKSLRTPATLVLFFPFQSCK
jgi:hypothetical protein